MRVPVLLAVILAVAAGCAAPDEAPAAPTGPAPSAEAPVEGEAPPDEAAAAPPAEPTPSEPEPAPPARPSPDPTPPTPSEPAPSPPPPPSPATPPTPAAPTVDVELRHDFASLPENVTFAIPEGASGLEVVVSFEAGRTALGNYACTGPIRIKVVRPDGSLHADVLASQATAAGPGARCGVVQYDTGARATDVPPGTWHADFSGQGVGTGIVEVRPAA